MKKILALVLVISMVMAAFGFALTTNAAPSVPMPDLLDGYENICLTYNFRPSSGSSIRHTAADLLPYTAYIDTNGNIKDFFMDTYLFLPYNTTAPSGATLHGGTNNPTFATDWTAYINDLFYVNRNVNALETAFGQTKAALNNTDKKAGVFFTIFYPAHNQTNFGVLGSRALDLSRKEDREYAIKWIIDEQLRRFTEAEYEHLELLGFYWLEEEIYSDYDQEMMLYASEYLHSKGLKFIWIPWYQAPGYNKWQSYGFDFACLQPNEIWQQTHLSGRVDACASLCKTYGMSMQIETRHETNEQEYFDRYAKYLAGGVKSGLMDAIKFYYQDGKTGVYYAACYSSEPLFRSVYDLTYKYAKGTLTLDDLGLSEPEPFSVPENVDWVSRGKNYTGCDSFVDGNGMAYQQVDGKELTDGVLGNSTNGTEWHAYHISLLDDEGRMSTTIDLGEVYTDLTHIIAHFNDYHPFNIGPPSDLQLYVSNDGVNFQYITNPKIKHYENDYYIKYVPSEPFEARYVKLSFTNAKGYNFVFCSEIMVGKELPPATPDEVPPENPETPNPEKPNPEKPNPEKPNPENPDKDEDDEKDDEVMLGDVNDSKEIDSMDYVIIKRAYFGTFKLSADQEKRGDVNKSGDIDSMDYVLIKRAYFGTFKFQ